MTANTQIPRRPRRLLEIANTVEAIQDGRIHVEKINGPFLFKEAGPLPNTRLGLSLPFREAGCGNTNPAPT